VGKEIVWGECPGEGICRRGNIQEEMSYTRCSTRFLGELPQSGG